MEGRTSPVPLRRQSGLADGANQPRPRLLIPGISVAVKALGSGTCCNGPRKASAKAAQRDSNVVGAY